MVTDYHRLKSTALLGLGVAIITSLVAMPLQASAYIQVSECAFDDTTVETDSAPLTTWTLLADCTTYSEIQIPTYNFTLDGNGHTIHAAAELSGSVISMFGIDNVTIKNLTVDSTGSAAEYGVIANSAYNINLLDVTLNNHVKSGLGVFDSTVSVTNLSTTGNGKYGIYLDTDPMLGTTTSVTLLGTSRHADTLGHIYLNDFNKNIRVLDLNNQYQYVDGTYLTTDRTYVLKPLAPIVISCDNGGWASMRNAAGDLFKNQGQCISYNVANANAQFKR